MKLKVPKMRYVFQAMVLRLGGTANARAVLNAQLDAWWKVNDDDDEHDRGSRIKESEGLTVASDTAFPRTFKEYCNVN